MGMGTAAIPSETLVFDRAPEPLDEPLDRGDGAIGLELMRLCSDGEITWERTVACDATAQQDFPLLAEGMALSADGSRLFVAVAYRGAASGRPVAYGPGETQATTLEELAADGAQLAAFDATTGDLLWATQVTRETGARVNRAAFDLTPNDELLVADTHVGGRAEYGGGFAFEPTEQEASAIVARYRDDGAGPWIVSAARVATRLGTEGVLHADDAHEF